MTSRVVWTVRHGERVDYVDPQWETTAARPWDPELTAKGKEQARLTGLDIAAKNPVTAVITSPFIRCVQTAAAIAAVNNNAPVYIEDGLSEWLNKKWFSSAPTFLSHEKLREMAPTLSGDYASVVVPTYPESNKDMLERYTSVFKQVSASVPGGNIALITHGLGIAGMLFAVDPDLEAPPPDFCALTRFIVDGPKYSTTDIVCQTSQWDPSPKHVFRVGDGK